MQQEDNQISWEGDDMMSVDDSDEYRTASECGHRDNAQVSYTPSDQRVTESVSEQGFVGLLDRCSGTAHSPTAPVDDSQMAWNLPQSHLSFAGVPDYGRRGSTYSLDQGTIPYPTTEVGYPPHDHNRHLFPQGIWAGGSQMESTYPHLEQPFPTQQDDTGTPIYPAHCVPPYVDRPTTDEPWSHVPLTNPPPGQQYVDNHSYSGHHETYSGTDTSCNQNSTSMSSPWRTQTSHTSSSVPQVMVNSLETLTPFTAGLPQSKRGSSGASNRSEPYDHQICGSLDGNQLSVYGAGSHSNPRSPSPSPSNVSITPSNIPDVLSCQYDDCPATFTGEYRRGNLGRHHRQKHVGKESVYECESSSCNKTFMRKDARLKHYRKYHPELVSSPFQARKG